MQHRQIGHIQEGVVVDHIRSDMFYKAMKILQIESKDPKISMANRYESAKVGEKGFMKIEGIDISQEEFNLLSLIAPSCTISWIRKGQVERKERVEIPGVVEGIVDCMHASCISREPGVKSRLLYDETKDRFQCYYCRHYFDRGDLRIRI